MTGLSKLRQPTFFLHVPKAAGTTFYDVLYQNYSYRKIAKIDGTNPSKSINALISLSELQLVKIDLVMGHFYFGLETKLPEFFGEPRYITMLRDPVARVFSLYKHIVNVPQHPLHSLFIRDKVSLEEFLRGSFTREMENDQVRRVAGAGANEQITQHHFERAIGNLERFHFVGITERFDESLIALERSFEHINHTHYVRKNVAQLSGPQIGDLSPQLKDLILENNRYDNLLYQHANEMLSKKLREFDYSTALQDHAKKNISYQSRSDMYFRMHTLLTKFVRKFSVFYRGWNI